MHMDDAHSYSAYELASDDIAGGFELNNNEWGGMEQKKVFELEEEIGCFTRWCCPGEIRPFSSQIKVYEAGIGTPYLHLERDYTCTMCCLCRPTVRVD